jgi:hypothetical protein
LHDQPFQIVLKQLLYTVQHENPNEVQTKSPRKGVASPHARHREIQNAFIKHEMPCTNPSRRMQPIIVKRPPNAEMESGSHKELTGIGSHIMPN